MAKSKKSTPWSRVQAAKKAVKAGRKGASAQLDKAVKAYAADSCKMKAAPKRKVRKRRVAKRTKK